MKILANDGIHPSGNAKLEAAGHQVDTTTVAQAQLASYINEQQIEVLLVRSATQVNQTLIAACPGLKIIGRGGIGMDNIDIAFAKANEIAVINTPDASGVAVAELVFGHLLSGVRFLHEANRNMPLEGDVHFKDLKKSYGAGQELRGKTIGIIGFGNIGQETAKIALGMGMNVLFNDPNIAKKTINFEFFNKTLVPFELEGVSKEHLLKHSDFISLHIPSQPQYCIDQNAFKLMKKGVGIINTARGNALDEVALVTFIKNGTVAFAGLDVFESEPKPELQILMNPNISLSPHIGAATFEAQERIGLSLAQQIIRIATL